MGVVKARVVVSGFKGSRECTALVDTGAAMTVIDRGVAEEVGVMHTGRRRALISASGHKLDGEVVVIRELSIEGEVLDYEKALAVELSREVKEVLRGLGVDENIIVGLATVELAGFIPDTAAGKLRKVEAFLF